MDDFTTCVRRVLRGHEITVTQLAATLECSPEAVRSRLRGRTPWKAEELARIAATHGLDPAQLLGLEAPTCA